MRLRFWSVRLSQGRRTCGGGPKGKATVCRPVLLSWGVPVTPRPKCGGVQFPVEGLGLGALRPPPPVSPSAARGGAGGVEALTGPLTCSTPCPAPVHTPALPCPAPPLMYQCNEQSSAPV